jgi:hypothetical protein
MSPAPFSREKIIQRSQKKRPKLPFIPVGQAQMFLGDQLGKKLLRQVLRLIASVAFSTHIDVNGIPVTATKHFQCGLSRL